VDQSGFILTASFTALGALISQFALYQMIPMTEEEKAAWLCGFVDGEANFLLRTNGMSFTAQFTIQLHIDCLDTLKLIQDLLSGIGHIRITSNGQNCVYSVSKLTDIHTILIPYLQTHGLFTTKALDFKDFVTAVGILMNARLHGMTDSDRARLMALKKGMNTGRSDYTGHAWPTTVGKYWLLGFFEAEGTAGVRGGHPYLQIGQHARSLPVLLAIRNTLEGLGMSCTVTPGATPPTYSLTINKLTDVYTLATSGVDSMYGYLLFPILSMPFQTRKHMDVLLWAVVMVMFKWGTAYLPAGKALIAMISAYMNNGRYSNNPVSVVVPTLEHIASVLALPPLVIRQPWMSQLDYSKLQGQGVKQKQVFVYENGTLLGQYNSYADAQTALGLDRKAVVVRRYIDTGKTFNGRYTFTSTKTGVLSVSIGIVQI